MPVAHLPHRAVIQVSGEDRVGFLQGLVSADIAAVLPGRPAWAALLTPQGKWFSDFFVNDAGTTLLLDVEADRADAIAARLTRFRLRAQVSVAIVPHLKVFAGWDMPAPPGASPDPRLPDAGWRALAADLPTTAPWEAWDRHRLSLGLPDGARDLEADHTLLLEAGFDELGGIAWEKGCWMGQELTARTRYRGLLKRRLVPVDLDGEAPAPGTPVLRAGNEVGTLRSHRDGIGLATLRLEALDDAGLVAGAARVASRIPGWMRLPAATPA